MTPEPEFLTVEEVLYIHGMQLERYGGAAGIRNQGLLESAVMTPQASFGGEPNDVDEELYQAMIDVSARKRDKAGLAELLRTLSVI